MRKLFIVIGLLFILFSCEKDKDSNLGENKVSVEFIGESNVAIVKTTITIEETSDQFVMSIEDDFFVRKIVELDQQVYYGDSVHFIIECIVDPTGQNLEPFESIIVEKDILLREDNMISFSVQSKVLIDHLNNANSVGHSSGINFIATPYGTGAVFERTDESRIELPFPDPLPHDGTIEMRILVNRGYAYYDYDLEYSNSSAIIFNTGTQDVWFLGVMNFMVKDNGSLQLKTGINSNPTSEKLDATGTNFKFNEWHVIGFSYGDQGQFIMVDGEIVASNSEYTYSMQAGGDWGANRCIPSIGELNSVFWENNQHDRGFEGVIDYFRISTEQEDWGIFMSD